jgi:MFS family permease
MPLRNVVLLAVSQTIAMSGVSALLLIGGIIGAELAPTRVLATMSISFTVVGVAVFTVPASLLMQRFGRRAGFVGSALTAAAAMGVAAAAIASRNFWLFCASTTLVGFHGAFTQQYRFAASESVAPEEAGRAISIVLLGGIFAGWLGPALATWTRHLIPAGEFVGSFATQGALYVVAALLLLGLKDSAAPSAREVKEARPLREIARQPRFILAVLAATTSYAVMSLIMTATPLQLHDVHHFDLADTAWVIQSHVMAMYIPSLVTGSLIGRFGVMRVMMTGTACLAACAVAALVSHELVHYWGALVVLGVGWNFQFVASTVLLGDTARPGERFRVQAVNDFTVFGVQAVASLSAGGVLFAVGWRTLNLVTLPLLALTVAAAVVARRAR